MGRWLNHSYGCVRRFCMPIYEYQCKKCGEFEVMQKITDESLKRCPTCRGKVTKLMSSTSFQLKGTGWYATDYARKEGKAKDSSGESKDSKDSNADKSASATESKSSKTDTKSKAADPKGSASKEATAA